MKKTIITNEQINKAILKMNLTPYSLIGDSIKHRAGYIRALTDLGIIDGLTAARMLMEIEEMKGWNKYE